jgi:hypothetical protein
MPEPPPLQATRLLQRLLAAGADFVVIGGVALSLHGSDRNTTDLDICFSEEKENLIRLGRVLIELKARLRGVEEDLPFIPDEVTLSRIRVLTLWTTLGLLDLLASPDGAPRYRTLAAKAARAELGEATLLYASVEHLIAMKEAAGRTRDLAAVEELKAIRRLKRGDPARDSFGQTTAEILAKIEDT